MDCYLLRTNLIYLFTLHDDYSLYPIAEKIADHSIKSRVVVVFVVYLSFQFSYHQEIVVKWIFVKLYNCLSQTQWYLMSGPMPTIFYKLLHNFTGMNKIHFSPKWQGWPADKRIKWQFYHICFSFPIPCAFSQGSAYTSLVLWILEFLLN